MEFRVVAMLRCNRGNNVSDAGHFECSHGPRVPHTCKSSGVTDGEAEVGTATHWITKCKNRAPLAYISVVTFLWFSMGCRVFVFRKFLEYFAVI